MIGILMLTAQLAFAEQPSITKWIKDIQETLDDLPSDFPTRIAFVDEKDGQFSPSKTDSSAFNGLSYLRFLSAEDISWSMKLNASLVSKMTPEEKIFAVSGANILLVNKDEKYSLMASNQKKIASRIPKKSLTEPNIFAKFLFRDFGYDGVVLDKKDTYYLVGIHNAVLGMSGAQALALNNSEKEMFIESKDAFGGSAILRLDEAKDGFGIFHVILQGVDSIKTGTKLVVEHGKAAATSETSPAAAPTK